MNEAKGFCTCKRDFPRHRRVHPAPGATWHYACDKPVLDVLLARAADLALEARATEIPAPAFVPTGTGWPVK